MAQGARRGHTRIKPSRSTGLAVEQQDRAGARPQPCPPLEVGSAGSRAPAVAVSGSDEPVEVSDAADSGAPPDDSAPEDSFPDDGLIRFAPLSTRSLAVSATHAPAACADSTIFVVMDLADDLAGRRLRAAVVVAAGRRLAFDDDDDDEDRADIFFEDLEDVDFADVDLADFIVRPALLRRFPPEAAPRFDLPLTEDRLAVDRLADDFLEDRLAADPLGRLPLPLFLPAEREAVRLVRVGIDCSLSCDENSATTLPYGRA